MAHVALNAHLLAGQASYRSAGIHHYIDNVLACLPAADPALRYTVFVGEGQPALPPETLWRSRWSTARPVARILWEQFAQPAALWRLRPDLLHSMAFVSPLVAPCPAVVTVYDVSFKLMPQRFLPAQRLYLSALTGYSCRHARRVLAISQSTKADVVRWLGVPADRVDVAPPGVLPVFRPLPASEVEAFRVARQLPERFILYLGTREPRKNIPGLLRAYAGLRAAEPGRAVPLVLAGARGWLADEVDQLIETLHLTEAVQIRGYIPAAELPWWYNAAAVFAYPSWYEGFGMPVVEALACGRPVVTSTQSSLPEAGGAVAALVHPDDHWGLQAALAAALARPPGTDWAAVDHAAQFTWPRTAAATAAAYQRALA